MIGATDSRANRRVRAQRLLLFAAFSGVSLFYWLPNVLLSSALNVDGRIYRRAAVEILAGGNPYTVEVNGLHAAAPPVSLLAFVPWALVPEDLFTILWLSLCGVSAIFIVRWLALPGLFLMYPPLAFGVLLGTPMIPGMALVLAGVRWLGLVIRPHLIAPALAERQLRDIVVFGALLLGSLVVVPSFLEHLASIVPRYGAESGPAVSAWGGWLLIPVGVSLLALARVDLPMAGWLVVPAVFPAVGWATTVMVLPAGSTWLAAATALPIPQLTPVAIATYCWVRFAAHAKARRDVNAPT